MLCARWFPCRRKPFILCYLETQVYFATDLKIYTFFYYLLNVSPIVITFFVCISWTGVNDVFFAALQLRLWYWLWVSTPYSKTPVSLIQVQCCALCSSASIGRWICRGGFSYVYKLLVCRVENCGFMYCTCSDWDIILHLY